MPANEPVQNGPYPVPVDPPDGPNQMAALATWAAGRLVMRFANTAARDAALPAPVDGMAATVGTGANATLSVYLNGAWRILRQPSGTSLRRTVLTGAAVYVPPQSSPVIGSQGALAIVDTDDVGNKTVSWRIHLNNVAVTAGNGLNIAIGNIPDPLRPNGFINWSAIGGDTSGAVMSGLLDSGGALTVRSWGGAAGSRQVYATAAYPIQATP